MNRVQDCSTLSPILRRGVVWWLALVAGAAANLHCGAAESDATSAQPSPCSDERNDCLSQSLSALTSPAEPGPRKTARFDLSVPLSGGGNLAITVTGPSDDGRELSRTGAPFPPAPTPSIRISLCLLCQVFRVPLINMVGICIRYAWHEGDLARLLFVDSQPRKCLFGKGIDCGATRRTKKSSLPGNFDVDFR